jgi:hypothetical protein
MLPRFAVELSQTAETAFTKLFDEAQQCPDIGKKDNHKVTVFRIIDRALASLSSCPFDENRALAGRLLSNVYVINLDSVCVYYHIDPERHIVFVRSIEISKTHPDLSWVRKPEFRNEATKIFDVLGIDGTDFLNNHPPFAVH